MLNGEAIQGDIKTVLVILCLAGAGFLILMARKGKLGEALSTTAIFALALIPLGLAAIIGTPQGQAMGSAFVRFIFRV